MSILTAIFQAILQAIAWILPISESGHSAIFHDFSARFTNACSQLTGIIHIGIAVGIIIAMYKLFMQLFKNFIGCWSDLFHKQPDLKGKTGQRKFMFMTLISFAPMLFYLIPAGKYGNVYGIFNRMSYNGNLIGEGICIALTGVLIITAFSLVDKKLKPIPMPLQALIIGVAAFLAVPTAGCSLIGAVLCIGILVGLSDKYALRYAMVMSVMVLIVKGIIEICVGVTTVSVIQIILALVFSIAVSFFAVKILIFLIKNKHLNLVAIYDIAIGLICFVIGVFEIVVK